MSARLRRRTLSAADLAEVVPLLTASDLAVLGRTDFTETEVETLLRNPDMQHLGWYDGDGPLVAYGWLTRIGESGKVELDLYVQPDADPAIGAELLAWLEEQGRRLVADAGHDEVEFHIGAYRRDERTRSWLRDRDFTVGTTFTRMRVDFDGPLGPVGLPESVTLRRSEGSEDDLRAAHGLREESFTEHYGYVPEAFTHWRKRYDENGPGWNTLWLAELDGRPIGLLIGSKQFVEDEDAGYVGTLGVANAARGRGIAKALLRQYFSAQQAEGRMAVLLHVDVANVTNALALYESVGMRPILEIGSWVKHASTLVDPDTPL